MPLVSIIISVYDQLEYTKKCLKYLESTLNHKLPYEVIIIDDFKVPNRPFQFDIYENFDLNFILIKDSLNHVFTNYNFFYPNDVKTTYVCNPKFKGVGKIYIFPSHLNINDLYYTDSESNINYSCFY